MRFLFRCELIVKKRDSLNSAEIIFQRDVFVRSVRIFVRQSETEKNTRNFKGIVHLGHEWNRTAFANEHSFLAEARLQSVNGFLENRMGIRRYPGLAGAQNFKLASNCFGQ